MAARRRTAIWFGRAVAVLIIGGLAAYLYLVGLDKADKLASALSLIVALVVLFVPLFRRRQQPDAAPATAGPKPAVQLPARGAPYLEEVRSFVPPQLLDRETELAQLAAFCSSDTPSYWRWVADAWSGKTALLAWFVLHPPENADVISFFITSRFNPHHNRDAFIEAVTEQLDALTGVRSTYADHGPIRTRHLQARLAEAAELSRRNGRTLVLVVDGLDEDTGIVVDAATYTIASTLPADPVAGLKVIAAGRRNPPLPAELSADHPLRMPANIHQLDVSRHAQANAAGARLELRRLLADTLGRQVVGLLVAAGGGLTIADLATLTRHPRQEVTELVESSAGRTFIRRPARWRRGPEHYTFGLAHEELRRETLRSFDGSELDAHRGALDSWSESVAAAGWPPETPEYLLRGYLGSLIASDQLARATDLATGNVRRERMLAVSGGDHAARVEIAELAQALAAVEPPEIGLLARLALHREYVDERNSHLPTDLPAVWVKIGDDDRAEALARGLSSDRARRSAVQEMTSELVLTRDSSRVERAVRLTEDPDQALELLGDLWRTAFRAGASERVDALTAQLLEVLPTATNSVGVGSVVRGLAHYDDLRAEQAQNVVEDPYLQAVARLARIETAQWHDDEDLAAQLTTEVEELAARLSERQRHLVLRDLKSQLDWPAIRDAAVARGPTRADSEPAASDEPSDPMELIKLLMDRAEDASDDEAEQLVDRAVPLLERIGTEEEYWASLRRVAARLAKLGHTEGIWELAERGGAHFELDRAAFVRGVVLLVAGLAARNLSAAAEGLLSHLADGEATSEVIADVVEAAVNEHQVPRARALFARMPEDDYRLQALITLAIGLHRAGDAAGTQEVFDQWWRLADRLLAGSRRVPKTADRPLYRAMVRMAEVYVELDRPEQAAEVANLVQRSAARRVEHPKPDSLRELARTLLRIGDLAHCEAVLPGLGEDREQMFLWTGLIRARLEAGQADAAEVTARSVADPVSSVRMLTELLTFRSWNGQDAWALAAELCEPLTTPNGNGLSPDDLQARQDAILVVARQIDRARAARLAASIADPLRREQTLSALCLQAARAGDDAEAERLFEYVAEPAEQVTCLAARMATATRENRPQQWGEFCAEAVAIAGTLGASGNAVRAWDEIVGAARSAGRRDQVVEVIDRIEALADDLAGYERDRALGLLMSTYWWLSRPAEARSAFERMSGGFESSAVLSDWCHEAVRSGDTAAVEEFVGDIGDAEKRGRGWIAMASAVGQEGDYRRAAEFVGRTTERVSRSTLVDILEAAAAVQDYDFAEAVIARGPETDRAAGLWCVLTRAAGAEAGVRAAGWLDRAEAAVPTGEYDVARFDAMARIADVAEPKRARRLVAQALVDGPWYVPLDQLARLDPAGFTRLVDVVVELVSRQHA